MMFNYARNIFTKLVAAVYKGRAMPKFEVKDHEYSLLPDGK